VSKDSTNARAKVGIGTVEQRQHLNVDAADIIQITRIRTWRRGVNKIKPFISETIILPRRLFPGLEKLDPMPNTLYDLFQSRYSITVTHIDERITPIAAPSRVADKLGLKIGTPLLLIDRTTYSLGGMIVEWRVSYCHMDGCHYRLQGQ
jgi:GntR family transcriptional regulator